jgi:hypothetical protein
MSLTQGGTGLEDEPLLGKEVLVADLDVLDAGEGLRVAEVGPQLSHRARGSVAENKVDLVERLLDDPVKGATLVDRNALETVAGVDAHDAVDVEVLEPVEVLEQAETIRVLVGPVAHAAGPLREGTDRGVPSPAGVRSLAFEVVLMSDVWRLAQEKVPRVR